MVFHPLSSPLTTRPLLPLSIRLAHDIAVNLISKMRGVRKSALLNTTDKARLARAVESSVHDFVRVATSNQKSLLDAIDAISLIKLCRQGSQPFHIAKIWRHIQSIPLLPANDERSSTALIGSVVSAALDARDSATAAMVCDYLRSTRDLVLAPTTATQLLSALRGKPDKVVEVISTLQQGTLGVYANPQHYAVALQALVAAPTEAKQVFELALKHEMVCVCFSEYGLKIVPVFHFALNYV